MVEWSRFRMLFGHFILAFLLHADAEFGGTGGHAEVRRNRCSADCLRGGWREGGARRLPEDEL